MLPNLKAKMIRQNITCNNIGKAIGKKSEWLENRLQGKAMLPVDIAMQIRNEFFPKLPYEYLFSKTPITPIILEMNERELKNG